MAETISVNLSGPALAFLLYENVKSKHEQEGFLLGDTNEIVTRTITDTDSHNEKIHKVININAVIPCPRTCLFYNNVGGVDRKVLENILASKIANVVGWYLYEPEHNFKLTLRSKIIHKELCNMFSISSDLFCCCLLSATKSPLESTFSYTHTFIRFHNRQFSTVPMHIDNLGESFNSYKPKVHASKSFLKLCQSSKDPKNNTCDWQSIDTIQDTLHSEVLKTMKQLSYSEHTKAELEREVEQLRQQIEFQKSIIEDKASADAKKLNEHVDDNSESNVNLMDLDIKKLINNELTSAEDTQEKLSSNLNTDLSIVNKNELKEKCILKGKDLNSSGVSIDEKVSNKVINEVNRIQKTDEQENILVDSPSTSSEVTCSDYEKNLIDLTLPDEEDIILNSQNNSDGTAISIKKYS